MNFTPHAQALSAASVLALLVVIPACGDDESTGGSGGSPTSGTGASGATGNTGGGTGATGNTGGAGTGGGEAGNGNTGNNLGPGNNADCTAAVGDPPDIALTPFASGFDAPLLITFAPGDDDRLYVIQQGGEVILIQGGEQSTFLDISDLLSAGGEQGLLGLAFHPNYVENGRFFVHYSDNSGGDTTIQEFRRSESDPNVADPTPVAEPLLVVDQPDSNHNGGSIEFSPVDGFLYIFLGDGGGGGDTYGNGQNPNTMLAKVLRIDVNGAAPYAVPPGNLPGGVPEAWDWGLRNPYRSSFDMCTGDMYIADVGQNEWEEINVEPAGQGNRNYGWPIMEATHCFNAGSCDQNGLTLPVAEYDHGDGCSVSGGHVYRGTNVPSLRGTYFYADYCSGTIWSFRYEGGVAVGNGVALDTDMFISGFGQDNRGEVYVVDRSGGAIHRIIAR